MVGNGPKKAHPHNKLTAAAVRRFGAGKYADGSGLYLVVDDSGARRWALRTTVHGRRREIGLGPVSLLGLGEARELARDLRRVARSGGDPIAERDKGKRVSVTFADAARIVHAEQIVPNAKNGKHVHQWLQTLETYAFPVMGSLPVHAVQQADILKTLAPIWITKPETARRVRQRLRTVLDWAGTAGHRDGINPVMGIEKGLPKQRDKVKHFTALPWRELPSLIPRIEAVGGMGALALRFCILTACRSGEARGAIWTEIDLDERVWTIPAERMKGGRGHRVPLSHPAMAVLMEVHDLKAGPDALVFPSKRAGKPLSDMTLSATLRRLDLPVTVHGFRSSFRDWSEESTSFPHEVKEAALSHSVRNKVEAAYRRTDLFEKRRTMMDAWGSFVTSVGAKVVRLAT